MLAETKEKVDREEEGHEGLTRRKLLVGAGSLAVGAVTSAGVLGINPGTALSKEDVTIVVNDKPLSGVPATVVKGVTTAPVRPVAESLGAQVEWIKESKTVKITSKAAGTAPIANQVPEWPWPYKKLDPEVVRKLGYENYFKGGCMFGTASALLLTLSKEVGFPYTTIPIDIYKYGAGGAAGWGTLCGSLNGASQVINMITKDFSKVINELIGWYTEFPFPSAKHESYCKIKNQITTVAKSPLCHASITKWARAAGAKVKGADKDDRCAKVSGDVAARTVELLNSLVDGKFIAAYKASDEFAHCLKCHDGGQFGPDQLGKMNCTSCHDDHTKK